MTKISPRTVWERINMIRTYAQAGDEEKAHGEEIRLHQDVLQAIAEEAVPHPAALARDALQTKQIKFGRYTA